MGSLLRKFLSVLIIPILLTSSVGGIFLQYDDPDTRAEAVLQPAEIAAPVSVVVTRDDGDRALPCNHGCHVANDLLAHLNFFSALSAIVPLSIRIIRFVVTPAPSMPGETLFRPPR